MRRIRKGKVFLYFSHTVFIVALAATTAGIAGPLTYDDAAHQALNATVRHLAWWGDPLIGLNLTEPRQNLFSLVRDATRGIPVVDHGAPQWTLGASVMNFLSRGAIATVADALRALDIPLTVRQARMVKLCTLLDQMPRGASVIVQPDPWQYGIASWYGPGFHGRVAASGEIFNTYDMTAAHRTLPLQSVVRVVSQRTGANVIVRVNDRGPYVASRVIDLSSRAKDELGMEDLAAVYLERIDPTALDAPCP